MRMQPKMGGKSHLKLNIGKRPIANKYREGKMKRTLKRELKVLEIVNREPLKFQSCRDEKSVLVERGEVKSEVLTGAHFNLVIFH